MAIPRVALDAGDPAGPRWHRERHRNAGTAAARQVLRTTQANGLSVVIVHDPLAPVGSSELSYLAGSNEAPEGFPGRPHAQEHMMFRGGPGLSGAWLVADEFASER